jgi:hypothetical protein
MKVIVQKYGGTVVAVVSAMSGETNRLIQLAKRPGATPRRARAGRPRGHRRAGFGGAARHRLATARRPGASFLGHQIRIGTDSAFGRARIRRIEIESLRAALGRGEVPVVAGFQGVDDDANITTLGRGGSTPPRSPWPRRSRPTSARSHRRRWRLHHRPAHLPGGAQARPHLLRRDARAGEPRRQGLANPLGGGRQALRRARSTFARASTTRPVPGSSERRQAWKTFSSPASRSIATRPRSPSGGPRQAGPRLEAASARSPMPASSST